MKKQQFAALMSKSRACYQNAVQDDDMWLASIVMYYEACKGFSDEAIERAFAIAWKTHKDWMPSLGQLVELIETGGKSKKLSALDAWVEVKKIAEGNGKEHSDPIAQRAIGLMGGAKKMGQMNEKDFDVWGKKEFEEYYADICRADSQDRILGPEMRELPAKTQELVDNILENKDIRRTKW